MPGWSVPVSALLAQLERQPSEYIIDPWVIDRATFVAIERDRLVAAAHVLRYDELPARERSYRRFGLAPINRTVRGWKRMSPSTSVQTSSVTSGGRSSST